MIDFNQHDRASPSDAAPASSPSLRRAVTGLPFLRHLRRTERSSLDAFALSVTGPVRPVNADVVRTFSLHPDEETDEPQSLWSSSAHVFLVADGIGQQPGRLAATLAADVAQRHVTTHAEALFDHSGGSPRDVLEAAALRAHSAVRKAAADGGYEAELGTTLTLACIVQSTLHVVHVGDSRCYLLHDGALQQLTKDHTFAQRLYEAGVLSAEQTGASQWKHVLWNVIGGAAEPELQSLEHPLHPGDRLLVCSDGLCGYLTADEMQQTLAQDHSAEHLCRRLVERALTAHSTDNVTAAVACFS